MKLSTLARQCDCLFTHSSKRLLESRQAQEEVLRLPEFGSVAAQGAAGFQQVEGVQGAPAGVALVAARAGVGAVGAGTLNVAVGKKPGAYGAIGQQRSVRVDVSLVQQRLENVVGYCLVILRVCVSEKVKGYAQLFPRIQEQRVIAVDHLGRSYAFLVGPDGNGRAVGVAARYHQHAVALEPVIAGENVGGQVAPGDVAEVQRAIGVGPGDGDENALRHRANP